MYSSCIYTCTLISIEQIRGLFIGNMIAFFYHRDKFYLQQTEQKHFFLFELYVSNLTIMKYLYSFLHTLNRF